MTSFIKSLLKGNKKPDYELNSHFNEDSIYDLYAKISKDLLSFVNMELGVLQAFSYCFYELADNVLNHSGKEDGVIDLNYYDKDSMLYLTINDTGMGIWNSLQSCDKYKDIKEEEALRSCIEDGVTDGKGRGFGLYSASLLIRHTASEMKIRSGGFTLKYTKRETSVSKSKFYQGTQVSLALKTDIQLPANKILADRADGESEFNECFLTVAPFGNLW